MTAPRLIPAEQSVACAINRAAGGRPVPGNQVHLLIDGPDTYQAMLEVIAQARHWVHFENYIIRSDSAGWRFAELLAKRAREGIHVRVLYDWFGSLGTSRGFWRYLRAAGVEVRSFHRPQFVDVVTNISRNHRKLVVADGSRAILGGLCIGCEWTGERDAGGQPWRDTAVDVHGPAAAVLDQTFVNLWEMAGGEVPPDQVAGVVAPEGEAEGAQRFQIHTQNRGLTDQDDPHRDEPGESNNSGSSVASPAGSAHTGSSSCLPPAAWSGSGSPTRTSLPRHACSKPCGTRPGTASMSGCWSPARVTSR